MILIEELSKIYKEKSGDVIALQDINLAIGDGDIFGIIGKSGAGKTTLLRILSGLEKQTTGRILINGEQHDVKRDKYNQTIGVVFQGFHLLKQKTVFENVAFPYVIKGIKKKDYEGDVNALLTLVGLLDKAQTYPVKLSGGQKQRVAIARALASNPKLLLLDEPTSALDFVTTNQILELIKKVNLAKKMTVLIITHEISIARKICNHLAVIDESRIVDFGETKDVFKNPKSDVTRELTREFIL